MRRENCDHGRDSRVDRRHSSRCSHPLHGFVTSTCHSCTRPLAGNVFRLCWSPAHVYPPRRDSCITMYGYSMFSSFLFDGTIAVPFLVLSIRSRASAYHGPGKLSACGALADLLQEYASHWRSFNQAFRAPTTWDKVDCSRHSTHSNHS